MNNLWKIAIIIPNKEHIKNAISYIYKLIRKSEERIIYVKDKTDDKAFATKNIYYDIVILNNNKKKKQLEFNEIHMYNFLNAESNINDIIEKGIIKYNSHDLQNIYYINN